MLLRGGRAKYLPAALALRGGVSRFSKSIIIIDFRGDVIEDGREH
jgi:hypothetical protein